MTNNDLYSVQAHCLYACMRFPLHICPTDRLTQDIVLIIFLFNGMWIVCIDMYIAYYNINVAYHMDLSKFNIEL